MDEAKREELVRIDLTPSQVQTVKDAIGREVASIELTVAELEERIAPSGVTNGSTGSLFEWRQAGNCNETLLV